MSGGSGSTQTTSTQLDPFTQQWRNTLFTSAQDVFNRGPPQPFPYDSVAPFSQNTLSGMSALKNYASQGAPGLQQLQTGMTDRVLSGNNPAQAPALAAASGGLDVSGYGGQQNPYLDSLYGAASRQVINDVNAMFARAGRFGPNAAYGEGMTRALGDVAASIYAPAYEAERGRQFSQDVGNADRRMQGIDLAGSIYAAGNQDILRGAALMPSIYQYGAMPGQTLLELGALQEGKQQDVLNDWKEKWFYPYESQWNNVERFANVINGMPTGSTQTTTQSGGNPLMGALGGGMAGAGLFSTLSWPVGLGAGLGALMGLF